MAAESWLQAEHEWANLKQTVDASQCLEFRYEDLVAATMQAVCEHIQIDYDERMLDPQTMGGEPPNPKHLDKWRTQILEGDIRLIEAHLDGLMQARGYEAAGLGSVNIAETKAKWLQITDRIARARQRAQTYDASRYLRDMVAHRVGSPSTQRRIREQINQIDDTRLREAHGSH